MQATATTSTAQSGQVDALALLKEDHDEVNQLFAECEQGGHAAQGSEDVIEHICRELKVHAALEEELFYPALRAAGVQSRLLDEAQKEHAEAKRLIEAVEGASSDGVAEPLRKLMQAVRHHVHEEEGEMFPAARECGIDLAELGQRMAQRKQEVKQTMRA